MTTVHAPLQRPPPLHARGDAGPRRSPGVTQRPVGENDGGEVGTQEEGKGVKSVVFQLGLSTVSRQRIFTDNIHLGGKNSCRQGDWTSHSPPPVRDPSIVRHPLGEIQCSVQSVCAFTPKCLILTSGACVARSGWLFLENVCFESVLCPCGYKCKPKKI